MKAHTPKEKTIQATIMGWLRLWGARPIRINSGAMMGSYKGKERFIRFTSEPGCSDLLCCLPDGRFAAIEVKRPGARTDPERLAVQNSFLDWIRAAGGLGLMVGSLEELRAALVAEGYVT